MNDRIQPKIDYFKENPDKPYNIRYTIEVGKFGHDDVSSDQQGLTQDLIFISCITQPSGGYSQTWRATDGLTDKPMHHDDVFKAWILMAANLREKPDMSEGNRIFCDFVFEAWRESVMGCRNNISEPEAGHAD